MRTSDKCLAQKVSPTLKKVMLFVVGFVLVTGLAEASLAQGLPGARNPGGTSTSGTKSGFLLYGDIKVDESVLTKDKPLILDIILYTKGMQLVNRQRINPNGRYRFSDVFDGDYWLVVESDGTEVARDSIFISKQMSLDVQHDIHLELRSTAGRTGGGSVVSAADLYKRSAPNQALYQKATREIQSKNYGQAVATLRDLVTADPGDFQAWSDLGMLYFVEKDYEAAENTFTKAVAANASYFPAVFSLGRVRLARKKYPEAIESLEAAVKLDPKSAQANYFLGEAYLQIKKGSKAVAYLNGALTLDPIGMAEAHIRLAALYNAAGMKDRAAAEYEQFLKKKPDGGGMADPKVLEKYIADNKKP